MSKIYLIFGYSINSYWSFFSLYMSKNYLNDSNTYFAPFDNNDICTPKFHNRFSLINNDNFSYELQNKFNSIKKMLQNKKDVLLFITAQDINSINNLLENINLYLNNDLCIFNPIFIIGKLCFLFDSIWKNKKMDEKSIDIFIDRLNSTQKIISEIINYFGPKNVNILSDLSDEITAENTIILLSKLFTIFGINSKLLLPTPPISPIFFNTQTAVRLAKASLVRHNNWPRFNNVPYAKTLLDIDLKLKPDPISPLEIRQKLLSEFADENQRLAQLLKIKPKDLDPPSWFYTKEAIDPATPIPAPIFKNFATQLPSDVRQVLLRRFDIDQKFLTKDQEALQASLKRLQGGEFKTISEQTESPLLTVLTMTYNHEKYIGECIESVLKQKTKFKVKHIILDHYSIDSTPDIVDKYAKEYPSIQPILLSYLCRTFNSVYDLFIRCNTDYAALCDGDDYFTDNLKLQKQVDFLENHPRCALCFHFVEVVFENGNEPFLFPPTSMLPRGIKSEYYLSDLLHGNMIQTNSVVYKWRFKHGLPDWFNPNICPGDWYWHLLHAEVGKIGFIPEIMSVYRRHENSLYKDSFVNRLKHRQKLGMQELNTYHVVNEHFSDRYFLPLAKLANGVFADFFELLLNGTDKNLFDNACKEYPKFAHYFLKEIKVRYPRQRRGLER